VFVWVRDGIGDTNDNDDDVSTDNGMMAMIELLFLMTLTLTFISSPSHGSLYRTRHNTLNDMLDRNDLQPPATVS